MRTMAIKRPAIFRYLQYAATLEEAKKTYKEYAVKLHPDKGGKLEDMQQLNLEWDYIKKVPVLPISIRSTYTPPRQQPTPPPPPPRPTPPRPKPRPESKYERTQENVNKGFNKFYQEQINKDKHTYNTSNSNVGSNPFDWDEFTFIVDGLFEQAVINKRRASSVVGSFYDTLEDEGRSVTTRQMNYIADKLGYKRGWVFFQREELNRRNIKLD